MGTATLPVKLIAHFNQGKLSIDLISLDQNFEEASFTRKYKEGSEGVMG